MKTMFGRATPEPRLARALAVAVLFALGLARWNDLVLLVGLNCDETQYHEAFALVARGRSPYEAPGYLYPYPLAVLSGWLYRVIGEHATMVAIRLSNLLGLVGFVWLSIGLTRALRTTSSRLAGSAFALLVLPNVGHVMRYGNLEGVSAGLGLWALIHHRRWPWLAGLSLGLSLVVKPLFAPVWLALVAYGLFRERAALRVAATALGVFVAALLCDLRWLPSMLRLEANDYELGRSNLLGVSRVLHLYGFAPHGKVVLVVISAALACLVVARSFSLRQLVALSAFACFVAAPLVWPHTMVLLLPVEVLAIATGVEALRAAATREQRSRAALVLLITVLGVLCLFNVEVVPFMVASRTSRFTLSVVLVGFQLVALLLTVRAVRAR